MKKLFHKKSSFLVRLSLCLLVIIAIVFTLFPGKKIYYIAAVGPMSGANSVYGNNIRMGTQHAIDEINSSGYLPGIHLKILAKDDQGDTEVAQVRAREIAEHGDVIGIAGHNWSSCSREAGPIYRQHRIPMVAPVATHPSATRNNDWAFSTNFTDPFQARYLAKYVVHGLHRKRISVIYTRNDYGITLNKYFTKELDRDGLSVLRTIEIPNYNPDDKESKENLAALVKNLARNLDTLRSSDIIFIAMEAITATEVLRFLVGKHRLSVDFIGGDWIGDYVFLQKAGPLADGVYMVKPFLADVLGKKARIFESNFIRKFRTKPDWGAAYAYDVVYLFLEAVRKVGTDGGAIKDYLRSLNSMKSGFTGITGSFFFDANGHGIRSISIGQARYRPGDKEGHFISAKAQLNLVKYPELTSRRKRESIFNIDQYWMKTATVVFTGMHINSIDALDIKERYFSADFNLWFRWYGSREQVEFDLVNGTILSSEIRELYRDRTILDNYICYRIRARISNEFPLQEYPFDEHLLKIQVKPKHLPTEDIILVRDLADFDIQKKQIDFGNWINTDQVNFVELKDFIYSFRNPLYKQQTFEMKYALYSFHVYVKRIFLPYLIKIILPLLIVIMVGFTVFFIDPKEFETNMAVGVTALLSAMAFHISQGENLPNIGYLVKADVFFIMTYFLIFLTIIESVISNYFYYHNNLKLAREIDRYSAYIFPVLLAINLALLIFVDF